MTYKPLETKYLIAVQRPVLWLASFAAAVLLVAVLVWIAYHYGMSNAGFERSEATHYIDELQQRLDDLQSRYDEKQRQAAMLERNSTIDGGATEELKATLDAAQAESLELKKELAFYKSIVSPEDTQRSLAIQTIQIKPDVGGLYRYKIMVSQRGRNDLFVRGSMDVSLRGSQDGLTSTLNLSALSSEAKKPLNFGFKYFQTFEGTMKLPEAFTPEFLKVSVKPRSSRIEAIEEQFAWADLTAGGEQNVGQQ